MAFDRFIRLLLRDASLGVMNGSELGIREGEVMRATGNWTAFDFALPDDFPRVRIALTQTNFAPDYFGHRWLLFLLKAAA